MFMQIGMSKEVLKLIEICAFIKSFAKGRLKIESENADTLSHLFFFELLSHPIICSQIQQHPSYITTSRSVYFNI